MPFSDETWNLIQRREYERREHSRASAPSPQRSFYSVDNSRKHGASNRYSNVLAYDRTAVLTPTEGYLNANIIKDGKGRWWVTAQAPTPSTFHPFFHAILSRSASAHPLVSRSSEATPSPHAILVQLTGWEENGLLKADPYLRPGSKKTFKSGSHEITLQPQSQTRLEDLSSTLTNMQISDADSTLSLLHYYFDAWPDHGIPEGSAVQALTRLVSAISEKREELGGVDKCEVWVHCSAGVGRTGTFIALSSLLIDSPASLGNPLPSGLGPLPPNLSTDPVASTVDKLRDQRGMMVQTSDQLQLIYDLVEAQKSEEY